MNLYSTGVASPAVERGDSTASWLRGHIAVLAPDRPWQPSLYLTIQVSVMGEDLMAYLSLILTNVEGYTRIQLWSFNINISN